MNQRFREETNPVFNTAKSTLLYLMSAGDEGAARMAEQLGVESRDVFSAGQRETLNLGMAALVDAYYETMNCFLAAAPERNIVDLGCGYTPRTLSPELANKRFIGCDLPAVIDEMGPAVERLLRERDARAEYRGADFTNFASLRPALEGVEGEICVTTEGVLAYLTESELVQLCANVRKLLTEFGGRWLTPDPEAGIRTIGTLKAVLGEQGMANVLSANSTLSAQSDAKLGANSLVMRFGGDESTKAPMAFLAKHGLRAKRLNMGERMPELKVFSQLSPEQRAQMRKLYDGLHVWEITPAAAACEPIARYDGDAFSLAADVQDDALRFELRGRMDSLSAPEFLRVYEQLAPEATGGVQVDCGGLEYMSSAGLRALLYMAKQRREVRVTHASEELRELFAQTGFDQILKFS